MTAYTDKAIALGATQVYGSEGLSAGTWTNGAKDAHHLTIDGATVVEDGPGPSLNKCLEFDGVNDVASTPHDADIQLGVGVGYDHGTHVTWVWNMGAALYSVPWSKAGANYELRLIQTTTFEFAPSAASGPQYAGTGVTGEWMMLVATRSPSGTALYSRVAADTNMVPRGTSTAISYGTTTHPFALGRRGDAGDPRWWTGRQTGYAMFKSSTAVLTTAQMDELYDAAMTSTSTQLATPTNFSFTAGSAVRSLSGSWNPVAEAGTYDWQVERDDGSWVAFQSGNTASTSFQLTDVDGVAWSKTYRSRVRSVPPAV